MSIEKQLAWDVPMTPIDARGRGMPSFGELLRRNRLEAGLSQEALAERARMSVNGISALERGLRRTPQRETFALLVEALQLPDERRALFESAAFRRIDSVPAIAEPSPQLEHLPIAPSSFVGRADELAELAELVTQSRLVTIVGSGGIGKTRTSLEVARSLPSRWRDGRWFVELAAVCDRELVVPTIARALGLVIAPSNEAVESLVRILAAKEMLLILDNCEHLVEAVSVVVAALLRACAGVTVLTSSRQTLRVAGERAYRLPSLSVPSARGSTPEEAMAHPAVALFVDRARAVQRHFVLSNENVGAVIDVCRRLDGIALAIELAASRVTMLSVHELRDRLDRRFHVLTGGGRDALPRQRTVRATLDWSYDLLEERERALLRRLSVFNSGFSIEGAVAVAHDADLSEYDIVDSLASLVDKSLVLSEADANGIRFRLLESTRAYGREMLEVTGERDDASRRHLAHFVALFDALDARSRATGRYSEIEAAFVRDLDDIRSALDYAARSGNASGRVLLVATTETPWRVYGIRSQLAERASAFAASGDPRVEAHFAIHVAMDAFTAGQYAFAVEELARGVTIARSVDSDTLSYALSRCALALSMLRRLDEARSVFEETESLALHSVRTHGVVMFTKATLAAFAFDHETAARLWKERVEHLRRLGNEKLLFSLLTHLAESLYALGDTHAAIENVVEAIEGHRSIDSRIFLIESLTSYGAYLTSLGEAERAGTLVREAISIAYASLPVTPRIYESLAAMAVTLVLCGEVERSSLLAGFIRSKVFQGQNFTELTTHARLEAELNSRFDPASLDAAYARGAFLSLDAAVAIALENSQTATLTESAIANAGPHRSQ